LEAMALGAPVITANNSSLKEIAEDAAVLIDSKDVNSIRRAVKQVLEDKILRQRLVSQGRQRSGKFSWEITVKKFMTLLK